MDFKELISSRLGGVNFYINSYYKFEKYSRLKNEWINNHNDELLLDFGIGEGDDMPVSYALDELGKQCFVYENRIYSDNGIDKYKISSAKHLKEIYNVDIKDPINQINHILGAKSALTIIPIAFINDDDIVISTTPGYEVLANMASWLKAKIYKVPLLKENNFLPDLKAIPIEIYQKCKIFVVNYPNNPTGAIANKKFYEELISLALKYNFLIVNDNTYGPLTYKGKPLSILSIDNAFNCAIEIHSMSKAFNMTGMRMGFVVGNPNLIDIFRKVKDNIDSGQYIPIQLAACKAIEHQKEYIDRLKKKYYERMKKVSKILNKYNIKCNVSPSTFYLYVKVPDSFNSADEFTRFLLDNAGIFTIPWDEVNHYVRLSMTFKVNTTEKEFYEELENRLKRLHN